MTLPNELHPGFLASAGGGDLGDTIEQSLRFSASNLDFQYVPSTTGDRRKWTWATWVKRGLIDSTCGLLGVSAGASDTQQTEIRFESNGFLSLRGYTTLFRQTKNRFRDPNAWYHIVVVLDIANSTANDRIKFYINGQKVTEWDSISNPGTTDEFAINYADNTRLGLRPNGSDPVQGLLAETYFLDGIAITDTGGVIDEFGRYNTDGVWVPKSYTGSFGPNNGYHLKYDSSGYNGSGGIGADHSGSGNNFTASNFDTTAISSSNFDNDIDYEDTPTSNYATGNPLDFIGGNTPPTFTFSNANLSGVGPSSGLYHGLTSIVISADDTNTYYMEFSSPQASGGFPGVFIAQVGANPYYTNGLIWTAQNNYVSYNGAAQTAWSGATYSADDVGGFSYNGSTGVITGFVNGVQAGTFTATTGIDRVFGVLAAPQNINRIDFNYGQRNFIYQPANTVALQTNNLPEPTIKNGKEHFGILTYTGDGATTSGQTVTDTDAVPFTPDLVWIKKRGDNGGAGAVREHILIDSVRGKDGSYYWNLSSNDALAETSSDHVSAIGEGSITVHDITSGTVNQNLNTFVAWCWKAGGTAVSNTNGSINSQVSANTDAGFSIVSYTGTGANATVGHGLNSAPEFAIVKNRDGGQNWVVGADAISSWGTVLYLNNDQGEEPTGGSTYWNNTAPTSSVINIGSAANTNNSGANMIAYLWHSVEGYSKFGSYTGGGSGSAPSLDGTFVYLGFRPSWLLIKRSNAGGDPWILLDSTRDTHNFAFQALQPNNTDNEVSSGDQYATDFLSNGFKCRSSNAAFNLSGASYVYFAFAESPFGGENVPPITAR